LTTKTKPFGALWRSSN